MGLSNIFKARAVITAAAYPVGKGQPRRSPSTSVWSLVGSGYIWYYGTLLVIGCALLGLAIGGVLVALIGH